MWEGLSLQYPNTDPLLLGDTCGWTMMDSEDRERKDYGLKLQNQRLEFKVSKLSPNGLLGVLGF